MHSQNMKFANLDEKNLTNLFQYKLQGFKCYDMVKSQRLICIYPSFLTTRRETVNLRERERERERERGYQVSRIRWYTMHMVHVCSLSHFLFKNKIQIHALLDCFLKLRQRLVQCSRALDPTCHDLNLSNGLKPSP